MTDRFMVVFFDPEGYWDYVRPRWRTAGDAVEEAKWLVDRAATDLRIARVMITDEDDFTAFLWERGKGIVYPTEDERTKA